MYLKNIAIGRCKPEKSRVQSVVYVVKSLTENLII